MSVVNPEYRHEHLNFANQNIRFLKWKYALQLASRAPVVGFGIGDAKNELIKEYETNTFNAGVLNRFNSHNQYLDTLLQSGLIGLIGLFAIFYFGYFGRSNVGKEVKLILAVFYLSFLTESMLDRHWGIVSFVLFTMYVSTFKIRAIEISNNRN
ncbi:hypothetical protein Musp01_08280 [Muricauda sp. NBRC 101325]|nr:hypothetical protein Musp01_08280 [Muricauda sp. NBRC 101325]